jgi:hypothetical protein
MPVGSDAPTVTPSKSELGLTDELAAVLIHAGDDVLTLEDAARHLYHARRSDDADPRKALALAAELARLRNDAEQVEDTELEGAAQALEESARAVFMRAE